ncbi:motA [Aeromonas phage 31]|uniref:Binds Mot boxes at phage middle promoters n=3 Tax=Biquartavirus 44RR2 TaxID=115987 RepID=Q6U967_9CAUD|nr:MotA-like activator of middle period transcription [Aeromonas phage 44RR2.8t]YP_238961.1 MotA-like activator of middle period transcription [Aeromonas phage 31]APU00707.1 transcriptional regulator of middle promoters [Aeromonas phage 44RR2.8t.2]APU01125.1 transcriptional regulator of middle promoters [Aeromonas phage 31.2]APU02535.1 transcriptional regulator of middle promoters [Aeromonas phage SW69-9]AAQ81553.1 binds Mot boxes at phage middle promoters [Aeromonas phage 44RR2.8t]AAX63721.1
MTMTKIEAIAKVLNNASISDNATQIFIQVAKKAFITVSEIAESVEMNKNAVYSNIGVMIKKELIEKSGDGYITTEAGDAILVEAAEMWKAAQPVEEVKVEKKKGTRKSREITAEMTGLMEKISALVEENIGLKAVEIYRQNYQIIFSKRTAEGYRKFEVLNNGKFRIFGYKVAEDKLEAFRQVGAEIKVGGSNTYIDIEQNEVNIAKVMQIAVGFSI